MKNCVNIKREIHMKHPHNQTQHQTQQIEIQTVRENFTIDTKEEIELFLLVSLKR